MVTNFCYLHCFAGIFDDKHQWRRIYMSSLRKPKRAMWYGIFLVVTITDGTIHEGNVVCEVWPEAIIG